ncbi:uncharacterized protein LOC142551020 isoform X2 [Primulina tabacum]|uniref:uncharacterized protein LOC142551020 isoform X2 n=1 Tax=Primulina tabacum TaxID=48773 RepID=UPI003F5995A8
MRIRKRFPPPSTPSDLHLRQSAAAQPKPEAAQTNDPLGQPSDKVMVIGDSNTSWAQPEDDNNGMKTKLKESGDDEKRREKQKKKCAGDDIRENNIPYEEECTNNNFMQPSSSSSAAAAKGTKALVPLKKRRGSFERSPKEETQMLARMKFKTNKKCDLSTQTGHDDAQNINNSSSGTGRKKSKRGNVIMEGSGCSRVNGRGWRCCQPTLVGYALCEHHLGKGRVGSMSRVHQRHHEVDCRGDALPISSGDLGLQHPLVVTKKRTKVGLVKARSISSLLSQI